LFALFLVLEKTIRIISDKSVRCKYIPSAPVFFSSKNLNGGHPISILLLSPTNNESLNRRLALLEHNKTGDGISK